MHSAAIIISLMAMQTPATDARTEEFVPDWAKRVVWYQILPERFRNGDSTNDPTAADIVGADPQQPPKAWRVHPWGSDWYERQEYERENGERELWKHLLRRRYGGDLQGVIDKLDYLHDLGITGIYFNPVFDSPSLHKYDGASYHHIDPNFGPDPAGDRRLMATENPLDPSTWVWTSADELALTLIREAHRRGIRVIFDGVFNHMGINSFAFKDLLRNRAKSAFKDWFIVTSWGDPATGKGFSYEGWYGVKSLPEFREDERGIADGPKKYIFAATERWMKPKGTEDGIDGWRLDVAYCVAHPFWKEWRRHVKSIKPDAYLTAELILPPGEALEYLKGDEFDGEMNYNFAFATAEFLVNPPPHRIAAEEFDRTLAQLRSTFPPGVPYVVQNLFGSHDANRIGSHIVNRGIGNFRNWGEYYARSKAIDNPRYDPRKPTEEERKLQKLIAVLQMTYVGAPLIYYGDEVGMWGGNDPDCRKPMIWDDIRYDDEVRNPDGSRRRPDTVVVDHDLLAHYRKVIGIRNSHEALQTGEFRTLRAEGNIFIFERSRAGDRVVVVINAGADAVRVPNPFPGPARDLLNDTLHPVETRQIDVGPGWAAILTPQ